MASNKGLTKAIKNKKDEFYTSYDVIQSEMNYYEDKFRGKTVLCNCDDPYESNFSKFFLRNFNYLGLKRLICTSYTGSSVIGTQLSLFDDREGEVTNAHGYVMDIGNVPADNGRDATDNDIEWLLTTPGVVKRLHGNGNFASPECMKYLEQADIVVTNPPFSKFRPFFKMLNDHHKKFLILGNLNSIALKDIFPFIMENKVWFGASIHSGDREFRVPDSYPLEAANSRVDENGIKYIRVKGVRWYTNIDHKQHHEGLDLYKKYYGHEDEYPKYDNFDAIRIHKTVEIPKDYAGYMVVPISFFDKYSPDQFEIVGEANHGSDGPWDLFKPIMHGKTEYKRLVIKNKNVVK